MALPAIGSIAVTALGGAYMNARYGIGKDLQQINGDKDYLNRVGKRIAELGDTLTHYAMFSRIDPKLDAVWFEGRTWTYGEMKVDIDRLAAILRQSNIKAGDFVAVFTINSPEMYVACLALSKLGAIAAMINTNLRDETLNHCLSISKASFIISTPDISHHVNYPIPHLSLCLYSFPLKPPGDSAAITYVHKETSMWRTTFPDTIRPAPRKLSDIAILIYTSGTTGKPKACALRNIMLMLTSTALSLDVANPTKYRPLRTYSALPLFHGTAFLGGLSYSLGNAGCLCLRRKFSATNFWKDAHDSRANRILYIGELCRYLLSTPPSPYDRSHGVTHAYGNGLRQDIYAAFKARFNVPEIREFYRSSEGLAKFDSHGFGSFRAGTVGFQGPIMRWYEDATFVVRFDLETERPWRDPRTGFCVRAGVGEVGEAIGRVRDRALLTEYLGNEAATEEKLERDVFVKGDAFQKMGDLLVRDQDGWVRFADRIGDSFRWKGENVSAGEVREHVCRAVGVEDAVIYGVKLARYDGQAGCAAISLKPSLKSSSAAAAAAESQLMATLYPFLRKRGVPTYAVPRLVRVTESISTGVTFKQAKGEMARKSWDPTVNAREGDTDGLYWLDGEVYRRLDIGAWEGIEKGLAKL